MSRKQEKIIYLNTMRETYSDAYITLTKAMGILAILESGPFELIRNKISELDDKGAFKYFREQSMPTILGLQDIVIKIPLALEVIYRATEEIEWENSEDEKYIYSSATDEHKSSQNEKIE